MWMAMNSMWFIWLAVMFLFVVAPAGYGWGYRGWGAPYPRYMQRRRTAAAAQSGGPSTVNYESWGWAADYLWVMVLIGTFWALVAFWWR